MRAVRSTRRRVVTFGGFGELGYEDEEHVLDLCARELDRLEPEQTIVNTGTLLTEGFQAGIAMIYPLARRRGFFTTGIHPSVALTHPKRHTIAPGVDRVFFVRDESWGGVRNDGSPSNTLRTLLMLSDEFIVMGGGEHTAQELRAFLHAGKPVRFHQASMHTRTADDWCKSSGAVISDYRGSAYHVWKSETRA